MSMEKFANHIIAVANEKQLPITNLQLQKIMYFVLRNAKKYVEFDLIKKVYSEPFLVWRYGPVVESQYNRFYSYGSSPIIEEYSKELEYEGFNSLIEYYLQVNVFKMVNASHTHSFWKKHESDIIFGRSDVPYPLEEVVRD
ncbi:TPA: DUF4065 domain-containing protein [Streptococcus pyogenes]|uniref:Panacea domain-containing protein n=1 Tax=Streptococcus pyogenes TaxID=1314 RepID=UPI00109C5DD1|nr:type II toxin-antitoxin system antitoxin SocA domain-containing protein [Streptococcus pyogenes]VHB87846.1 phage protein [Streptococcus pyogenes]HES2418632.1 DUF4065 domain-containing protein [Streptococcus pyogenes]HES2980124.1 DUF4065 domain-containing protein [Streptococcus pyogenes]HES5901795.1 DUF4065 domain-containing protein [Streptococcus pyogenes]HES8259641.1 DUF4065 domain-containing protein [Streptococcus pyogenes]